MHIHWIENPNIDNLTVNGHPIPSGTTIELFTELQGAGRRRMNQEIEINYEHATAGTRTMKFFLDAGYERFSPTNAFTISAIAPVINAAPRLSTNLGGGRVVIEGENFSGATAVKFGGVDATSFDVDISDPTKIIAFAPPSATPGDVDVSVTTPGGTVTRAGLHTYTAGAPDLTSITPNSGPINGGTAVTIVGENLTGATDVKIGGTSATSIVVVSDTQITAVTPAGTVGTTSVEVIVPGGVKLANSFFTYVETTEKTRRIIASYLQDRANNLLNTRPDITSFLYGESTGGTFGNLQLDANARDFNLSFSSSLGRIMRKSNAGLNAEERSEEALEAALENSNAYDTSQLAGAGELDYDLWVQVHGSKSRTTDANSTLWVGQFGGHKFVDENTLLGAMVQFDWADQSQRNTTGRVDGVGWMVGPYFAAKVPDQSLALDAFFTWGRSNNNVSPDGTYTDKFETERWMANAKLSGIFESNGWIIQPAVEVSYFKETQFSYIDSRSSTIPEQSISMGEMRFGPSISRQWTLEDGTFVHPTVGVAGVWNFAVNKEGLFPSSGLSSNDLRARFEVGLTIGREDDWSLNVSGFYDGVGTEGFESYGGKLRLSVPLP